MSSCEPTNRIRTAAHGHPGRRAYHRFKTARGHYIYDFATNGIIKVDEDLFENIDRAVDAVAAGGTASDQVDCEALAAVQAMQADGLLQRVEAEKIVPAYCGDCIDDRLGHHVQMMCLELSEQCNLRCRYCVYSDIYPETRVHNSHLMPEDTALQAIDHFLACSDRIVQPIVSFYGGEPLLNGVVLKQCVARIKQHEQSERFMFTVDTNGTLLDEEWVRYFMENRFIIQISLDGPQEIHDRYRVFPNGKGSWERVKGKLDTIWDAAPEFYASNLFISCTLAPPYPIQKVDAFFAGVRERNLNLMLSFVDERGVDLREIFKEEYKKGNPRESLGAHASRYMELMCTGRRDEVSSVMRAMYDRGIIDVCRRSTHPSKGTIPCNGICLPGERKFFVAADGTYYPCERVGTTYPIGDVEHGFDLAAIKKMVDNYRDLCTNDCHDCWAARLCSHCFASVREGNGMSLTRKREECGYERSRWHATLVRCMTIHEECPESLEFVKNVVIS